MKQLSRISFKFSYPALRTTVLLSVVIGLLLGALPTFGVAYAASAGLPSNVADPDFALTFPTATRTAAPTSTSTSSFCVGNLLKNPSFEEGGSGIQPPFWSVSNGTAYQSSGYQVDGAQNGYLQVNTVGSEARLFQDVTGVAAGTQVNLTFYGGTHKPAYNHTMTIEFYNAANTLIGASTAVQVDLDVDLAPYTLQQYSVQATVPNNTSYVRVVGRADGDYLKLDALCLQGSPTSTPTNTPVPPTNTPTTACTGLISSIRFWNLSSNTAVTGYAPIPNGATIYLEDLPASFTIDALTSGAVGSVKFTLNGASTIENNSPYRVLGDTTAWSPTPGAYTVSATVYQNSNASGTVCDTKSVNFTIANRPTATSTPTNTPVLPTATKTPVPPTATPTKTPAPSTATPTNTATKTPVPPTTTPTATPTNTTVPSTATPTATATNTTVSPTPTATKPPVSPTATPTNTTVPPTATPTNTATNTPVAPTATPTTLVPPTATSTQPTTTATNTPVPPTATATQTPAPLYDLGNRVWNDLNHNSLLDGNEQGINNVTVRLLDSSGSSVLNTTTTTNGGYYRFDDLVGGSYMVEVLTPANTESCTDNASSADPNNGQDKDDNGVNLLGNVVRSNPVTVGPAGSEPLVESDLVAGAQPQGPQPDGNAEMTIDFCFSTPLYDLGNRVWNDANNNGLQDDNELGLDNVVVRLLDSTGATVLMTTTTANGGYYRFDNLSAGNYLVEAVKPAGMQSSGDIASSTDPNNGQDKDDNGVTLVNGAMRSNPVTLGPTNTEPAGETDLVTGANPQGPQSDGNANMTVDFGFYSPVKIGDYVWYDHNNNGRQDDGAVGVPNVKVILYNALTNQFVQDGTGNPFTVTTDSNGLYHFANLPPADYYVRFDVNTLPPGYTPTQPHVGDNAGDSDADATGKTDKTGFLPGGSENLTLDLGIVPPVLVNLGNLVWYDANNDGQVNNNEPGIANVLVQLYRADQKPGSDQPLATATTDQAGHYAFNSLLPGNYVVYLPTPPVDYPTSSTPTATSDDRKDNDDNGSQTANGGPVSSPVINLSVGQEPSVDGDGPNGDLTIDFGFFRPVRVGDYVWIDSNDNNRQDSGEPGVPNVKTTLYDAATNQPVKAADSTPVTKLTDNTGRYLFDNLPPGNYYVVFDLNTLPAGYKPVQSGIGDDAGDSDADAAGKTHNTNFLPSGSENLMLDLGIHTVFDLALRVHLANGQPATVKCGDNVVFTIEVFNQGTIPATTIEVTDYVPVGMTLNDGNWVVTENTGGSKVTRLISGPLAPGASTTLDITFHLDANCTIGNYTDFAEISQAKDDQNQPRIDKDSVPDNDQSNDGTPKNDLIDEDHKANLDADEDDQDYEAVKVGDYFDLALRKTLAAGQSRLVNPGDAVVFTIVVFNQGTLVATNIEVTDYIPDGLHLNDANWIANGAKATTFLRGALAPGQSASINITFQIDPSSAPGAHVNFAEISDARDASGNVVNDVDSTPDNDQSNDGTPKDDLIDENHKVNPSNDEDDQDVESITVTPSFDLALRKSLKIGQPSEVKPGDNVVFTIRLFNQGSIPATNIEVVDYVPAGLTLNDENWMVDGGKISHIIPGPLLPGASTTVDVTLRVNPEATPGTYVNTAEIASAKDDQGQSHNDVDSTPDSNKDNDGTLKNDVIDENHKQNPAGDEDDHDIEAIKVGGFFDLALRKTLAVGQASLVRVNDNVTFVIQVINQGTLAATNIQVTDYVPAGLELNDNQWTLNGDKATRMLPGPLLPGQSAAVEITFHIAPVMGQSLNDASNFVNVAEISDAKDGAGNPATDIDSTPDNNKDNDGTAKDNVVAENHQANPNADEDDQDLEVIKLGAPDLLIQKTANGVSVQPGGQIVYTIVFTNAGSVDATNVMIKEVVPQHTTFVPGASTPGWRCADVAPGSVCSYTAGTVPARSVGSPQLIFVVKVDTFVDAMVNIIRNQVTIIADASLIQGAQVSEANLLVEHPTGAEVVAEPNPAVAQPNQIYLPLITQSVTNPEGRSGFKAAGAQSAKPPINQFFQGWPTILKHYGVERTQ